jgi:hypothetical protein
MYTKILKETARQLTLLVVENQCENPSIGQSLAPFFKAVEYTITVKEALAFYRYEKFDLVLIDRDTEPEEVYQLIQSIQKLDPFQTIVVRGDCRDNPKMLLTLLNSGIAGFLPKSSSHDEMGKILFNVCGKIQERSILMHYIETLEHQLEEAIKSKSSTKKELKPIVSISLPIIETLKEEDDDFIFFPELAITTSAASEDASIYNDYFSFLDLDDREELIDQLSEIDASLLNAFRDNGGNAEYINRLGSSLMRYGNVLLHYQFFSDMGTSILEFGKTISDDAQMIAERSEEFQMLISGFCSGLQTYMLEVWDTESANPKFFNDSIINDAQTIMGMMEPPKASDNGNDDLFFF